MSSNIKKTTATPTKGGVQKPIEVNKIVIGKNRFNSLNPDVVEKLKKSIKENGQYQSIMLLDLGDGTFLLIGGYHRYTAIKELGNVYINATIFLNLNNDELKIMELEENVVRNQFDHFTLGKFVIELDKLYQKMNPIPMEKKPGKKKGTNSQISASTGIKTREIQRAKKLGEELEKHPKLVNHFETKKSSLQNTDMKTIADFDKVYVDKFISKTKDNLDKETAKQAVKELVIEIEEDKETKRNKNLDNIIRDVCYKGNSLDILKKVPANYFNHCITDIPYGIGVKKEMGKDSADSKPEDWDFDIPNINLFEEIYRTIKPGGFFVTTFSPRLDLNLKLLDKLSQVGFNIVFNQMYWVHESNMGRSYWVEKKLSNQDTTNPEDTVDSKEFHGEKTASLSPSVEPIIIVQKPFESTIKDNAINAILNGDTSKGTINVKDTSINDRQPQQIISLDEINKLIGERFSIKDWSEKFIGNFLYASKPNSEKHYNYLGEKIELESKNSEDKQNDHASVKPVALFAYLIKLFNTDKDSIILEPFAGSGTTLLASKLLDVNYFGIEMMDDHYEIIKQRLIQDETYTIEDFNSHD